MDKTTYPASEYGRLRRLVAEQKQGWRLRRKGRTSVYTLTDTANMTLADQLTADEVRRLCAVWRHWRQDRSDQSWNCAGVREVAY